MNEAPKKIYLVKDENTDKPMDYWYTATTDDSKIEYIRTDAFIEKALEWIRENIRPYYHDVRYKYEHFKKYMEENSNEG